MRSDPFGPSLHGGSKSIPLRVCVYASLCVNEPTNIRRVGAMLQFNNPPPHAGVEIEPDGMPSMSIEGGVVDEFSCAHVHTNVSARQRDNEYDRTHKHTHTPRRARWHTQLSWARTGWTWSTDRSIWQRSGDDDNDCDDCDDMSACRRAETAARMGKRQTHTHTHIGREWRRFIWSWPCLI